MMHRCTYIHLRMSSRTISLEESAYRRLRAAKRPGESFTDAVNRLLSAGEPSFLDFRGFLPRKAAEELARTVAAMRQEDVESARRRFQEKR